MTRDILFDSQCVISPGQFQMLFFGCAFPQKEVCPVLQWSRDRH